MYLGVIVFGELNIEAYKEIDLPEIRFKHFRSLCFIMIKRRIVIIFNVYYRNPFELYT